MTQLITCYLPQGDGSGGSGGGGGEFNVWWGGVGWGNLTYQPVNRDASRLTRQTENISQIQLKRVAARKEEL